MHQILAYGNEQYEEATLLANVSAKPSSIGVDGSLTKEFRDQVLRQLASMDRTRGFEAFQLQYVAPGANQVRTESWKFVRHCEDIGMLNLADGRWLYRHYDVTEELTHIAV